MPNLNHSGFNHQVKERTLKVQGGKSNLLQSRSELSAGFQPLTLNTPTLMDYDRLEGGEAPPTLCFFSAHSN